MFHQYVCYAEKDGDPVVFRGWSSPPATDRGLYRILIWNVAGGDTKWVAGATLQDAEREVGKYVKAVSDRVVRASRSIFTLQLRVVRWNGVPYLAGGPEVAFAFDDDLLPTIAAGDWGEARSVVVKDLELRLCGIQLETLRVLESSADWSRIPNDARELASSMDVDDTLDIEFDS